MINRWYAISLVCIILSSPIYGTKQRKAHNKTKTTKKNRLHACSYCHRKFPSSYLKIHTNAMHLGKKVKCPHCPREFKWPGSQYLHIDSDHKHIKYQCQLCNKSFTRRDNRARHVNTKHPKILPSPQNNALSRNGHHKSHAKAKRHPFKLIIRKIGRTYVISNPDNLTLHLKRGKIINPIESGDEVAEKEKLTTRYQPPTVMGFDSILQPNPVENFILDGQHLLMNL